MRSMKNRCAVRHARGAISARLCILLAAAGPALAGCGERAQPAATAPAVASETAAPLLEITGDDEFRGTFAEGEGVRRVVTVRNRGSEAVTLAIPAKSCACVKSELAKDTLAPGESTTLSFEAPASIAQFGGDEVTHWVALAAMGPSSSEPVDLARIPLRFRSARDWRAVPGTLEAIASVGNPFEIEAFIHSASGLEIEDFRVGSCTIAGVEGRAERIGPSLWRVVMSGRLDSVGLHEGYLEVEPLYRKGQRFSFPVTLRTEAAARCEPAGVVIEGTAATEFRVLDLPETRRGAPLHAVVSPPNDRIMISPVDGAQRAVFEIRASGLEADYGGAVEVRDDNGALVARVPLAVFRGR
jgi:hypothetical protein